MTIATMKPGINTLNTGGLLGNLSDGEKKELANNFNAPDLELLAQRKKKLFEDIKAFDTTKKYKDYSDRSLLLRRLFEHSVEDGLKLSKELKFTPNEHLENIKNENFRAKHPEIIKQMEEIFNKKKQKLRGDDFMRGLGIDELYRHMMDAGGKGVKERLKRSIGSPIASKLFDEMDDIYSQYLRIQEFTSEHPNDPRTTGERLAEGLFQNVENSGKYYKTRVVEAVYDAVVKKISPAKENYYYSHEKKVLSFLKKIGIKKQLTQIQSDEFIAPQMVNDIINAIKTNIGNFTYDEIKVAEQIQKHIKDAIYKPLGMIFHSKNYLAEKQNKAEMEQVLASKFGKDRKKIVQLVYDKKEGIYKVEEIKNEEIEKIGNQNEAVLEKVIHEPTFIQQVGPPKVIHGKVFFKALSDEIDKRVMTDEEFDNIIGDHYDEIGDYIEVGGKLYFTAREGPFWSVIAEDGTKEVTLMNGSTIKGIIEFNGKRLIVVKEGDSDYIIHQNGPEREGPYSSISDIHVVDNELVFITTVGKDLGSKKQYLNKKNSHGSIDQMGPYDMVRHLSGVRDTRYTWRAMKGTKDYGIDKNRNETEGSARDIIGFIKAFEIHEDMNTGKLYIPNKAGIRIIDGYDKLYGPREHNGKKIFVGKMGNDFDKRVVNDSTIKKSSEKVVVEKTTNLNKFHGIKTPKIIGGEMVFEVNTFNIRYIVDENLNIISEGYDEIGDYIEVGGKLFFTAKKGGKWMVIDEKGNEQFRFHPGVTIKYFMEFDGKRLAITREGRSDYINHQLGKEGPYTDIRDINIIDNNLVFKTDEIAGNYLNRKNSIDCFPDKIGPYGTIQYQGDRNSPYLWIAKKGNKCYGIDKDRNETEGKSRTTFSKIEPSKSTWFFGANMNPKKFYIKNREGIRISDKYDKIYGPREHNGQTMFIGKKDNTFQKLVINTEGIVIPLTEEEQKKLDLLNLCVPLNERPGDLASYKEKIENYLAEESELKDELKKTRVQKLKTSIQQSGGFLSFLNKTIKQLPQLFIDTLPAKKDKNEKILAEEICRRIFPEAFIEEKKENSWYRGIQRNGGEGGGNREIKPEDYLTDLGYDAMEGGDPGAESKEILQIRGTLDDIISRGIFSSCDEQGMRKKVYFPIDVHISGPQKTTTINIPKIKYNTSIILAKPIDANIIPERVKGITEDGKEIDIPVSTNALNESTVIIESRNIKEIVYSIEQSILPPKIADISTKDYDIFKKRFISMYGEEDKKFGKKNTVLLDHIAQPDEEELLFLDSIKNDAPKKKLIKIEQYVRKHSFYDENNKEVANLKSKKSIDEKIYVCKKRIDELKEKKSELALDVEEKKRAGVCADFATISAVLLRKAGFISGVISGFMSSGSTVNTTDAHGVAYAIFPDEKGKNQIIIVDGTPHGSENDRPSLEELETIRNEQEEKIEKELEASLEEITKVLNTGNKDEIDAVLANMFNGSLEDLLNITLKKEVHLTHYTHLQNLLNAYRYSPIKDGNLSSPQAQKFITQEIQRGESTATNDYKQEAKAGTMLFEMTHQFVDRFTRENGNKYQALDRLDNIIDTCKNALNTIEYKSMKIIIKYLRAEKMKGKIVNN